jgi:type I restriction enzyme, S subunit
VNHGAEVSPRRGGVRHFAPYPAYKDSGVEWLGQIPAHWEVKPNVGLFRERNERGRRDLPILEVSIASGVRLRQFSDTKIEQRSEDLEGYKVARHGDIAFNKMRMWQGAVGSTPEDGLVSPDYVVAIPHQDADSGYYASTFRTPMYMAEVYRWSHGIVDDRNRLYWDDFKAIRSPFPPPDEQRTIATFLDRETARIDALMAKKERLIELLQEKRTTLITRAVTKGLDPTVAMKDAGVEWLGEIPVHWEVTSIGRQIVLQRGVDITKDEQNEGSVPVVSSGGVSSFHDRALAKGPGVVVGRKGTAGSLHYVECDFWPHDTTLWVREFRGNCPRFVYFKLSTLDLASFDTGTANPTLNRNLIHPLRVSWPPIREQRKIAAFLDRETAKLEALIAKIREATNRLKDLRTALISAAVTGKIDVRSEVP